MPPERQPVLPIDRNLVSGMVEGEEAALMHVTVTLNPEEEKRLMTRLHARGVSLDDYLQELIARDVRLPATVEAPQAFMRFDNLSDLLLDSPFAGANLDLERSKDYPRPVELE